MSSASRHRNQDAVIVISSSPEPGDPHEEEPVDFGRQAMNDESEMFGAHFAPEIEMQDFIEPEPQISPLEECLLSLKTLFPDLDPQHAQELYATHVVNQGPNILEFLANHLIETNGRYPKIKREEKAAKRKREPSPAEPTEEELSIKYSPARRPRIYPDELSRKMLRNAFPFIPAQHIDRALYANQGCIFPTYKELAHAEANQGVGYKKLLRPRRAIPDYLITQAISEVRINQYAEFQEEFNAAKKLYDKLTIKSRLGTIPQHGELGAGPADEELFECQCCFGEIPSAQLTQCLDGHIFCLECGRRNAETEIGRQRYKLLCMDGSGCRQEFSAKEIQRFCDTKMQDALERLEQRDVLQQAGIDGLSECPFCDFAAIVPPVEEDREFRCLNPDCMTTSCRLCNKPTHVPLTCEEHSKNENQNLRKNVEEAMTEALLRKCGNCGLAYVKESGCNKIICSRCSAMNCYLCSKVIKDYKHFNDATRGGKAGNCLLFDNTDERHRNEVQAAEEAAIAKIRAENPEISEEEMRIQLSQVVIDGERQRIEEGNRRLVNNVQGQVHYRGRPAVVPLQPNHPPHPQWPHIQPQLVAHPAPQVIYRPVPIPVQQIMQLPAAMIPQFPGIPNGPLIFPQVLRNPVIQAQHIPVLGNPVPFLGGNINIVQNIGHVQQPLNIVQRVQRAVNLIPRPAGALAPNIAHPAPYPVLMDNVPIPNAMPAPYVNPVVMPNAPAPIPPPDNIGFIQRNFNIGGNRLVRARQPGRIYNQNPLPNQQPIVVINDNVARQVIPDLPNGEDNDKVIPLSPVRNRPSKIAKRK
ncbi:hypothetical protein H072_5994 [Dactylellina haptotyla CBS 200.50]|uniref:RING-type domain-containing protein n=1 Tax=Dactylellina haptotyla (strain CBS 200.50) TaxID=1284197 RepID=S8ABC6_DACHA|nr:hypothetical protein H072_5994 [Dactylellina haptotyla CBS 200.50]